MWQDITVISLTTFVAGNIIYQSVKPKLGNYFRTKIQVKGHSDFIKWKKDLEIFDDGSCTPYQENNNKTLMNILKTNSNTEYGKEYDFSNISDVKTFQEKLPIIFYKDISDKIDNIVENNAKNILSVDKIYYFATSSGTTGKQKMIPITSGYMSSMQQVMNASSGATYDYLYNNMDYRFTNSNPFLFVAYNPFEHKTTKHGYSYGPLSQGMRAMKGLTSYMIKIVWHALNAIPFIITDKVKHFETNLLLQVLFSLLEEDINSFSLGFGAVANHFFILLRIHYKELINCVKEGTIYPCEEFCQNIPKHIQDEINTYIQKTYSQTYRKKRAEELESYSNSFKGIIKKIWPNIIYFNTSVSGAFSIYENNIREYLGNEIPILGAVYMSSEASIGFQYNIDGEYMFCPSASFFEFIPENEINSNNPKTLLVTELEIGKKYELVLTTQSGFYRYRVGDVISVVNSVNSIPLFRIAYRTGSILDAFGEKTTEEHIENSLKRLAESYNSSLIDFTTYLQIDASPVIYKVFFALSDTITDDQISNINTNLDTHLRDIHKFYDQCREQSKLGNIEAHLVSDDTFLRFKDILIKNGTGSMQVKIPHLLVKQEYLQYFLEESLN